MLIAILGVCGIFGNTAAVILFRRKRQYQSNFYALMSCLALFDMFYIILAIIIFSLPKFSKSFEDGAWQIITPWAIPLIQINLTGSIYARYLKKRMSIGPDNYALGQIDCAQQSADVKRAIRND